MYVLFVLITHKDADVENFKKICTAYTIFYVFGTLLAMQIPFVQFLALTSSEHMASHIVFVIVLFYQTLQFLRHFLGK